MQWHLVIWTRPVSFNFSILTSAVKALLFFWTSPRAQMCLEIQEPEVCAHGLWQGRANTEVQSGKERAASATGSKTKGKTSLACVSISLLPRLKKEPVLERPGGWRPLRHLRGEVGVRRCSQQQPGGGVLRLGDLCFQRSRRVSSRCAAVSQKEFIKVVNNGRNWSSSIGFLLFSLVHLPLMNCCHSFFCWVLSLYLEQV